MWYSVPTTFYRASCLVLSYPIYKHCSNGPILSTLKKNNYYFPVCARTLFERLSAAVSWLPAGTLLENTKKLSLF